MNILIPDIWLRSFLKTNASPKKIKECLSLCGPSVERINTVGKEIVYDIEVTGNRPDAMSVVGIAREAATILPRFGIEATLLNDPYAINTKKQYKQPSYSLNISTIEAVNPRFSCVVIDNVQIIDSPQWMQEYLTLAGMRPINIIVDVTNFLMKAYGQPVHAFDFDQILPNEKGIPTMALRLSKKHETIKTLDGKVHTLPGDDIVIEDGTHRLIDLCGIMGGGVSHITNQTKRIVLFVQTYDPSHIRKTSMALSHRTEAAGLFEKGLDTELVMPTLLQGIELITTYARGTVASTLYDIYPHPYTPSKVSVSKEKTQRYIGSALPDGELSGILNALGLKPTITKTAITVTVPSFRRDIALDVDVIEEIARIYGYHAIQTTLPDTEPPLTFEDPILLEETKIKHLLRDWGYTETLGYSMVSPELMDVFQLDKKNAYEISNPLSNEWVYLRPSLIPSILLSIKNNVSVRETLQLFELSNEYRMVKRSLPEEHTMLVLAHTGNTFFQVKGIGERLLELYGIQAEQKEASIPGLSEQASMVFGSYGSVGLVDTRISVALGIHIPVTVLTLDIEKVIHDRKETKNFSPIPKYPPSYEDIALVVPEKTPVGPMISRLKAVDPLILDIQLLDQFKNTRTLHFTYQSMDKNLTSEDTAPIREKLLQTAKTHFNATLKSSIS